MNIPKYFRNKITNYVKIILLATSTLFNENYSKTTVSISAAVHSIVTDRMHRANAYCKLQHFWNSVCIDMCFFAGVTYTGKLLKK